MMDAQSLLLSTLEHIPEALQYRPKAYQII